jgi:hypothetical protein
VTTKSPVIVPPAFALIELLALVKAAAMLLFCVKSVASDNVTAELAKLLATLSIAAPPDIVFAKAKDALA